MSFDSNQSAIQAGMGATVSEVQTCLAQLQHMHDMLVQMNGSMSMVADLASAVEATQAYLVVLQKNQSVINDMGSV